MRYIQALFRGRLQGLIHIIKGSYGASDTVMASGAANLVETWCGAIFQDRAGLLPSQETEAWRQGVSSDQPIPARQERVPPGVWRNPATVCSSCQGTLQTHTEYPGQLAAMDNNALYQEFRDAHRPDYYDGEFTTEGELRLRLAVAEMERRLRESGFLSG